MHLFPYEHLFLAQSRHAPFRPPGEFEDFLSATAILLLSFTRCLYSLLYRDPPGDLYEALLVNRYRVPPLEYLESRLELLDCTDLPLPESLLGPDLFDLLDLLDLLDLFDFKERFDPRDLFDPADRLDLDDLKDLLEPDRIEPLRELLPRGDCERLDRLPFRCEPFRFSSWK